MTTETPAKVTATTLPDEPLTKIIKSLADLTKLNTMEARGLKEDWIRREPVMQAVMVIRDASYALLQSFNAERLRAEAAEAEVARLNGLYFSAIGADTQGGNDAKQI